MFFQFILNKLKETKLYQDYIIKNLKKDPLTIFKINDPSYKLLFKIIDLNPKYLINFINLATPNHVKHAIYKNERLVRFFTELPNISDEIKMAIIDIDYTNIIYLRNLNEKVIKHAILANPYSISFIQDKIPDNLLKLAIHINPETFKMIKNPSEDLIKYVKKLGV